MTFQEKTKRAAYCAEGEACYAVCLRCSRLRFCEGVRESRHGVVGGVMVRPGF